MTTAFKTAVEADIWNGHDNIVSVLIREDGVAKDLSGVTRMVLTVGSTVVDTATAPLAITWDANGKVNLKLGSQGLAVGTHACELVAYDPAGVNGVVLIHPSHTAQLTLTVNAS